MTVLLSLLFSLSVNGKTYQTFTMDEAVAIALANHPVARNIALSEKKDAIIQQQSLEFSSLQVKYWQRNAGSTGADRLWTVTQDFGSIPEHFRRSQHNRTVVSTQNVERELTLDELAWQVKSAYMDAVYYRQRLQIMQEHADFFEALISDAEIHLFVDDSISALKKVSAGSRFAAYHSRMYIAEEELKRAEIRLRQLMYIPEGTIELSQTELQLYQIHPDKYFDERFDPVKHTAMDAAQLAVAQSAVKLEKSKLFPALHAGYIYQNIEGMNGYQGLMIGLSVPLWMQPQRARIKLAEMDVDEKIYETNYRQFADRQHVEMLKSLLNEYFVQISYRKENLLLEAQLTLDEIANDFWAERITDYAEAFSKASYAVYAKLEHLEYINLYNKTALELEFFTQ